MNKNFWLFSLSCLTLIWLPSLVQAAPGLPNLNSAVGSAVATGTTASAGNDYATSAGMTVSCGNGQEAPDKAYLWTAPSTGIYRFDTFGSNVTFDTALQLRTNTVANTELGCNDDVVSDNNGHSRIDQYLTAGTQVVIVVDGFTADSYGTFVLNIARYLCSSDSDGDATSVCGNDGTINTADDDVNDITDLDLDNDLVLDLTEVTIGTNRLLSDTDADSLADGSEVNYTDPLDDDTDDDGLMDGYEQYTTTTDPNNVDSDLDGLHDGTEVGLTTPQGDDTNLNIFVADSDSLTTSNPTNNDTDGGRIVDGFEDLNWNGAINGGETNVNDYNDDGDLGIDTDGDSVPDSLENSLYHTDPLDSDSDDDSLSDGYEILVSHTNPLDLPPVLADTTAPVITVYGANPLTLTVGATFTDPGATAVDSVDGVVAVNTRGTVNTASVGNYTITYTARDAAGNSSSKTRPVFVVKAGTIDPVIEAGELQVTNVTVDNTVGITVEFSDASQVSLQFVRAGNTIRSYKQTGNYFYVLEAGQSAAVLSVIDLLNVEIIQSKVVAKKKIKNVSKLIAFDGNADGSSEFIVGLRNKFGKVTVKLYKQAPDHTLRLSNQVIYKNQLRNKRFLLSVNVNNQGNYLARVKIGRQTLKLRVDETKLILKKVKK